MKDLTVETLIAVFEEIFGRALFWIMVDAALIVTLAFLFVLIRDRSVSWRKFLLAQLSMPVGAVAAVWFLMIMTHSHLSDIGGPVDVIVLLGVAAAGAVGMAVLVYTVEALVGSSRTQDGRQVRNRIERRYDNAKRQDHRVSPAGREDGDDGGAPVPASRPHSWRTGG